MENQRETGEEGGTSYRWRAACPKTEEALVRSLDEVVEHEAGDTLAFGVVSVGAAGTPSWPSAARSQ